MNCSTYFEDFLEKIRLTDSQGDDLRTGHKTLVERLDGDSDLEPAIVSIFLQGSYRRGTIVRPVGDKKSDVDIVVVTRLSKDDHTPRQAIARFEPFVERYYPGKFTIQGRSIGIELSYVKMDLVVTAAPSEAQVGILKSRSVITLDSLEEAKDWKMVNSWVPVEDRRPGFEVLAKAAALEEEWKAEPLLIPDHEAGHWVPTHPLEQMRWTREMNRKTSGHYINVVKALKWWQRNNEALPKHPKGYPLERLIGECCPDSIESVAEGVFRALANIKNKYEMFAATGTVPVLADHGTGQNVFKRITPADFSTLYQQASQAANLAQRAYEALTLFESAKLWRELLGNKFDVPEEPQDGGGKKGGFVAPVKSAVATESGRYG